MQWRQGVLVLSGLVLCFGGAARAQTNPETAKVRREIAAVYEVFYRAVREHDVKRLETCLAPDLVVYRQEDAPRDRATFLRDAFLLYPNSVYTKSKRWHSYPSLLQDGTVHATTHLYDHVHIDWPLHLNGSDLLATQQDDTLVRRGGKWWIKRINITFVHEGAFIQSQIAPLTDANGSNPWNEAVRVEEKIAKVMRASARTIFANPPVSVEQHLTPDFRYLPLRKPPLDRTAYLRLLQEKPTTLEGREWMYGTLLKVTPENKTARVLVTCHAPASRSPQASGYMTPYRTLWMENIFIQQGEDWYLREVHILDFPQTILTR